MPSRYDEELMTQQDKDAVASYQQQWKDAKANGDSVGMAEANAGANAIREKYGYTGGTSGDAFNPIDTQNSAALNKLQNERDVAINDTKDLYNTMINNSQDLYKQQQDAVTEWGKTQQQLQDERTDFTIEQIQQKEQQAEQDYIKEQKGAYADWQKQSNAYGVNAEVMAQNGMVGSGYSESSQVAMYNAYQGRVATARETYNRVTLEFTNAIKDAQLQNNAAKAEIAYQSLMQGLQLGLEAFQYNNSLLLQQKDDILALKDTYYNRMWNERQDQWNRYTDSRNFLANREDTLWQRDFNERQFVREKEIEDRNYQLTVDEINRQLQASRGSSRGSSGGSSSGNEGVYFSPTPVQETPVIAPTPTVKVDNQTTQTTTDDVTNVDKSKLKGTKYEKLSATDIDKAIENGELETFIVGNTYYIIPKVKVDLSKPFGSSPFSTNKSLYK